MANTTHGGDGRLCNCIIRTVFSSLIAEKYNLYFEYELYPEIKSLGIPIFINGTVYHTTVIDFKDEDFHKYMYEEELKSNIRVLYTYFQNPYCAKYLRDYFNKPEIANSIKIHNRYNNRYQNNNDIYIHVRLGDCESRNHGIKYYSKVIESLQFTNGYISSDSLEHPLCNELIQKYNLIPLTGDGIDTIMFGSTCENIILSNGTFSWMIGVFGYHSTIYYPDPKLKESWHGEIFIFDDWNKVIQYE
jgi:hypothetical protein